MSTDNEKPTEATAKDAPKQRNAVLDDPPMPTGDEAQVHAIQHARELFRIGDYAGVKETISPLLASKNPLMVDAANELQRRITVDPVQIGFLMACFGVIVTIALVYFGH